MSLMVAARVFLARVSLSLAARRDMLEWGMGQGTQSMVVGGVDEIAVLWFVVVLGCRLVSVSVANQLIETFNSFFKTNIQFSQ